MSTFAFGLLLFCCSVMIHYETLRLLNDHLGKSEFIVPRAKVLVALIGAMVSHTLQIILFGVAYYVLRDKLGLGGFAGRFEDSLATFIYFSSETYTTLGFGDIYPTGGLRMICGFESLMGLLMMSWTASFTYLEMKRYWDGPSPAGS
ncbi:MAG: ion channel [Betaproteobacteria bacterium]